MTPERWQVVLDALDWQPVAEPPVISHQADLEIAGSVLRCYQLSSGERVVCVEVASRTSWRVWRLLRGLLAYVRR
jgi:hypothetical protein